MLYLYIDTVFATRKTLTFTKIMRTGDMKFSTDKVVHDTRTQVVHKYSILIVYEKCRKLKKTMIKLSLSGTTRSYLTYFSIIIAVSNV